MTRSEQFVQALAEHACLRLWTYASPRGKEAGKELCDTLVACPPHAIVFSVKEVALNRDADDIHVAVERWERRAVAESVEQVYGAVRRLLQTENVTTADGAPGVNLGPPESRHVHRIAVAVGGEDLVPLQSRDYGQGFVHVFGADTLLVVLRELDTITDLVGYLDAREELLTRGLRGAMIASEHDLLAVYLMNTHSFRPLLDSEHDVMILTDVWDDFVASPQYKARTEANEESYIWDGLITMLHDDHLADNMDFGGDLFSVDATTRVMARENRTERRALGQAFIEFMDRPDIESRLVMGTSGTAYVFLKKPHAEERKYRTQELEMRVWIARAEMHKLRRSGPVVGIATEIRERGSGSSIDAILLQKATWSDDDAAFVEAMRNDLGLFANPVLQHKWLDEFPQPDGVHAQ